MAAPARAATRSARYLRPRLPPALLRRPALSPSIRPHVQPRRALATLTDPPSVLQALDTFTDRHVGPNDAELTQMLAALGFASIDAFVDAAVPAHIRLNASQSVNTPNAKNSIDALSERELLARARQLAEANKSIKSLIGMGYHNAVVPTVILRNVCRRLSKNSVFFIFFCPMMSFLYGRLIFNTLLHFYQIMENPAWYTPYTPYQPEIAQGQSYSVSLISKSLMSVFYFQVASNLSSISKP